MNMTDIAQSVQHQRLIIRLSLYGTALGTNTTLLRSDNAKDQACTVHARSAKSITSELHASVTSGLKVHNRSHHCKVPLDPCQHFCSMEHKSGNMESFDVAAVVAAVTPPGIHICHSALHAIIVLWFLVNSIAK